MIISTNPSLPYTTEAERQRAERAAGSFPISRATLLSAFQKARKDKEADQDVREQALSCYETAHASGGGIIAKACYYWGIKKDRDSKRRYFNGITRLLNQKDKNKTFTTREVHEALSALREDDRSTWAVSVYDDVLKMHLPSIRAYQGTLPSPGLSMEEWRQLPEEGSLRIGTPEAEAHGWTPGRPTKPPM